MPLPSAALPLNRENCIPVMLAAFQSNSIVKALIFLPGVTDDFYLVNRGKPLDLRAGNLVEALIALTNTTDIRVSFQSPSLLVHLDRDRAVPIVQSKHAATATRLQISAPLRRVLFCDRPWTSLQPELSRLLGLKLLPIAKSREAAHLTRVNFAGWGLTDCELLGALSLASRTTVTIQRNRAVIESPSRFSRGD